MNPAADLNQDLGVELCFRSDPSPRTWERILDCIGDWSSALKPATAVRLSDPEQVSLPWSGALGAIICRACATGVRDGWMLAGSEEGTGAITLDVAAREVRASLALPRPPAVLIDAVLALIGLLEPINTLGAAMAFDLDAPLDRELILQGLDGLDRLPPLLYLDERSMACAGGSSHVQAAPCTVLPAPGGLLLVIDPDPWEAPRKDSPRRTLAVERYFGIGSGRLLVLR